MPRTIDVDERRRVVSEAAWRVLVRDGPAEMSVRKVAAEAGLPPSSLRYTFPTQASVRSAAVRLLVERVQQRVVRAASATRGVDSARAILLELLPLDAERRDEMEVTVSLIALATAEPALREAHEQSHRVVRDVCAEAHLGSSRSDLDLDLTHAVVDGLALHLLAGDLGQDASWAIAALDRHLAALRA
jgi:AcrR family transcriptional regulator